jgi:hypothetical protein
MAIEVLSQSNWVDYVEFNHDSGEVSTGTSFVIHFNRSIAVASLLSDSFQIYDVEGDAFLVDPWMGIIPARDYSLINSVLGIYLELPLEASKIYQLYIQDLEDGAGVTQPSPHIVQFVTSPVPSPVDFRLDETPTYLDDQSIIAPSIAEESGGEHATLLYVSESSPPDGTMQIDIHDTSQIVIRFTMDLAEPTAGQVTVYSHALDRLWHPYLDITSDLTIAVDDNDLIITFPSDATPVAYMDINTEYQVVLSADLASSDATPLFLGEQVTLSFFAELQPLYVDPLDLADQFPDKTVEELYLMVYMASLDAYRFGSLQLAYDTIENLPYAAQEYTRLRAIYLNASTGEENASQMQLADLMISTSSSWLDGIKSELDRWQYELEIQGGSKRLASFTKASGLVPPPEEISPTTTSTLKKYTGSQTRRRNDWYDG